jgi:hypothetical protein
VKLNPCFQTTFESMIISPERGDVLFKRQPVDPSQPCQLEGVARLDRFQTG